MMEDEVEDSSKEAAIRAYLRDNGWTRGLQTALIRSLKKIPMRYIIVDDSGSMIARDGKKSFNHTHSIVKCTRWEELTESLTFHVGLAEVAQAPTQFRFLNSGNTQTVGISISQHEKGYNCTPTSTASADAANALYTRFRSGPNGGTPLCAHIRDVITDIRGIASKLIAAGQKCVLIIATDGEASDGNVATAMEPLRDLPVQVVLRLCTDSGYVGAYWNQVDKDLELNMDVLDDLVGEAQEVYSSNPWLTYAEPIHRLREFGTTVREFDLLDEKPLNYREIRNVCCMMFDVDYSNIPDPENDLVLFNAVVNGLVQQEAAVWSPADRAMKPWVDTKKWTRN